MKSHGKIKNPRQIKKATAKRKSCSKTKKATAKQKKPRQKKNDTATQKSRGKSGGKIKKYVLTQSLEFYPRIFRNI